MVVFLLVFVYSSTAEKVTFARKTDWEARTCLTSLNLSFCALGPAALDLLAQLLLKGGFLARGLPQGGS